MKKILKNEKVIHGFAALIVVGKKIKTWCMQSFSKRAVLVATIALLLVIVGVGTTFALLRVQAQGEVTNAFQSAKINVQIMEENSNGDTFGSDTDNEVDFGVITSEPVSKIVKIQNIDSSEYPTTDTFVRCRIIPIIRDSEGNNIAIKVDYLIDGKDSGWEEDILNGETYYYWTKVLPKGGVTNNLFEKVTVTSEVPDGAHLELQVLVDAVQARPYAASENREDIEKTPVYQAWQWYYDTTTQKLKK